MNDIVELKRGEPGYPVNLMNIPDSPEILYVKGSVESLSKPGWSVVGSRKSSNTGNHWARAIARALVLDDLSIVSGLAAGIDANAHQSCVDAGGITVAVLANGLDMMVPKKNAKLADRILENGGALVSELPVGTPPSRYEFMRRNRIQSGLSIGSIIVEGRVPSGTLTHVRHAMAQHRPIKYVLPNDPGDLCMELAEWIDDNIIEAERLTE